MKLVRVYHGPTFTLGIIAVGVERWWTLEPPWRNNVRNASCIPPGTYPIAIRETGTRGRVIDLVNVADRSGIMIHPGNTPRESKGCVLPGRGVFFEEGIARIVSSRLALDEIITQLTERRLASLVISE